MKIIGVEKTESQLGGVLNVAEAEPVTILGEQHRGSSLHGAVWVFQATRGHASGGSCR